MSKKVWLYLTPLIVFFAAVLLLASGLGKDPTKLDSQLVGKSIPKFQRSELQDPTRILTEKDIQGPALVNIFGSWCPTCYQEHPYFMQMKEKGIVKIYGLNYKDTVANGLKYIAEQGNPYEFIISDPKGRLGIEFGVYGAPETFVINAENKIVYRHVGMVTPGVWATLLKPKLTGGVNNANKERTND